MCLKLRPVVVSVQAGLAAAAALNCSMDVLAEASSVAKLARLPV